MKMVVTLTARQTKLCRFQNNRTLGGVSSAAILNQQANDLLTFQSPYQDHHHLYIALWYRHPHAIPRSCADFWKVTPNASI
ncbi:MAG: hypothetical protein KDE53_37755, partial [Caldilineaceae bacterium]|nr:hypothetical protein [Caldilineaceae bacterium]